MSKKAAIVIGSGVSGLSAAAYLAKAGFKVTVLEKNNSIGGRARKFEAEGFTFDMGPSWYWMPDVFEKFYADFGYSTLDFYELKRLNPSYQVSAKNGVNEFVPSAIDELEKLFERYENGSALKLRRFLADAKYKYEVGMQQLAYKPGLSFSEFANLPVLKGFLHLDILSSIKSHIRQTVKHPFLIELLEFPSLFLGALPQNTPALYSLMNYADMVLGTWYPMGGMYKIIEAFETIATKQGVEIKVNCAVKKLDVVDGNVNKVHTSAGIFTADVVIGAADYNHIDQHLLEPQYRSYSEAYWEKRQMAPSCLLYYVGVNKSIPNLQHHNLFFDTDFKQHANEIYNTPQWPSNPLFYVSAPSKTDNTVAPTGCENLFLLIPIAPGLKDTEHEREYYFNMIVERLERYTQTTIKPHIVFKQSYAPSNFLADYNAFKGNAYGLANTLTQTALLKPKIKSKKVNNLYFCGQLTVPGPGVPPSIISGNIVSTLIAKKFKP